MISVKLSYKTATKKGNRNSIALSFVFALFDFCAEGCQSQFCEFETLQTEGNTNDRDAPEQTQEQEEQRREETAENYPNNVCDRVLTEMPFYVRTERPNEQTCKFERLQTERNTDDGDTPKDTQEEVRNCTPQAGEKNPQKVA